MGWMDWLMVGLIFGCMELDVWMGGKGKSFAGNRQIIQKRIFYVLLTNSVFLYLEPNFRQHWLLPLERRVGDQTSLNQLLVQFLVSSTVLVVLKSIMIIIESELNLL